MQAYINYLLEDIAAAQRPDQTYAEGIGALTPEDEFEEIERWVQGNEPSHNFSYYCGLKPEQSPPADKLNKKQMIAVCKALNHLLFSWNLDVDIPKKYPIARRYALMVSLLNEKVEPPNCGFITFDFCGGYPPDCAFEEYCTCRKYYGLPGTDIEKDSGDEPDALPF